MTCSTTPRRPPPARKPAGTPTTPAGARAAATPPMRSWQRLSMTCSTTPRRPPPARKPAGTPTTPAGVRAAATLPIRSLTRWDIPMKPARFSPPARRKDIPCIPASAAKTGIPMRSFPAAVTGSANGRRSATPPAAPIAGETAASIRARFPASRLPVACCSGTRRHMISRSVLSAARLATARG